MTLGTPLALPAITSGVMGFYYSWWLWVEPREPGRKTRAARNAPGTHIPAHAVKPPSRLDAASAR